MSPIRKVRDPAFDIKASSSTAYGPRDLGEDAVAHASPARDLQAALAEHLQIAEPTAPDKWPRPVRLSIIVGGSALAWAGLALLVRAALRL